MAKTSTSKPQAAPGVLSLKMTLADIKPPIWRRILMRGGMTLGDLHVAIQIAMGWDGGHLHAFDVMGRRYGDPSNTDDVTNEDRLTLNAIVKSGVSRFSYKYDFGDDWNHVILIEKRLPAYAGTTYPVCVAGARSGPPEDCGGPWGYENLLEVLANPEHPDYEEQREWLGHDFDPEAFSIEAVNATLATCFSGRKVSS